MNSQQLAPLTALTALLLAGCGGDSGSSGGSPSVSMAPTAPPTTTTPVPTVSVSTAKDQAIGQDSSTDPVVFQVMDSGGSSDAVDVTAQSSNPDLFDPQGLVLGGNGDNRTVMLFPKDGASGTAVITLTATGANAATASSHFNVNVTSQPRTTSSMVMAVAAQSGDAPPLLTTGYKWTDDAASDPNAFDAIVGQ